MKVGFLTNQLDNRGTGNALFDYAHYNEEILGNASSIFTFANEQHNEIATRRFTDRFQTINYIRHSGEVGNGIDVLYHIKYGTRDGFKVKDGIKYAVHAVFRYDPHGDRYAAVSKWLGGMGGKYVPHIISTYSTDRNFRELLRIPKEALVIGRHGGFDTFDIDWVWDSISESLDQWPDLHFIFMNTEEKAQHPRIHYLQEGGPKEKKIFLNTCDAMLHARERGETFGIAIGEFASLGKPVMTFQDSGERAHIEELGEQGLYYKYPEDIVNHISDIHEGKIGQRFAYTEFSPENVMKKFKEVFLDASP